MVVLAQAEEERAEADAEITKVLAEVGLSIWRDSRLSY